MKTIALVCNFILLAFECLAIITSNPGEENLYLNIVLVITTLMNLVLISGSRINTEWLRSVISGDTHKALTKTGLTTYNVFRLIAVALNFTLIILAWLEIRHAFPLTGVFIVKAFVAFIIFAPFLSAVAIMLSRWDSFGMFRQTFTRTFSILAVLFIVFFFTMRIWIGNGIKENIRIAELDNPGKAEDALLAYLADTTKSPMDRTNIAVWTLGQIRSQKALPVLQGLYRNDPEGHICRGHHNTEICQYELHKAIVSIQSNWLGAKEKNWFGSWARLNK